MDFLQKYLNADMLFWGIIGIVGLVGFVTTMRIMRKGRESYGQRQKNMDARIQHTAQSARDFTNTMAVSEHVHIVAAALREQIELSHRPSYITVEEFTDHVELVLSSGRISIAYAENIRTLRSTHTVVRGAGLWHVRALGSTQNGQISGQQGGQVEAFSDLLALMQHIEEILDSQNDAKGKEKREHDARKHC